MNSKIRKKIKRIYKKALISNKLKSCVKSIYFNFLGKGNLRGMIKHQKNIWGNDPYYNIENL